MSLINIGKTTVSAVFDSGFFKNQFNISNEYLSSYWFNYEDEVWNSISSQIAIIIEVEIKKRMRDKMNEESYKKEFKILKDNPEMAL